MTKADLDKSLELKMMRWLGDVRRWIILVSYQVKIPNNSSFKKSLIILRVFFCFCLLSSFSLLLINTWLWKGLWGSVSCFVKIIKIIHYVTWPNHSLHLAFKIWKNTTVYNTNNKHSNQIKSNNRRHYLPKQHTHLNGLIKISLPNTRHYKSDISPWWIYRVFMKHEETAGTWRRRKWD